jgi:hypothetical protein
MLKYQGPVNTALDYGHIALSRVSAPVVGFMPLRSILSQRSGNVFVGNCASVKSAFSKEATSKIELLKYDPTATTPLRLASSIDVSSKEAPLRSAPSKFVFTWFNETKRKSQVRK